jgi:hypothetical protein
MKLKLLILGTVLMGLAGIAPAVAGYTCRTDYFGNMTCSDDYGGGSITCRTDYFGNVHCN